MKRRLPHKLWFGIVGCVAISVSTSSVLHVSYWYALATSEAAFLGVSAVIHRLVWGGRSTECSGQPSAR